MCRAKKPQEMSRRELMRMSAVGAGSSVFGLSLLSTLFARDAWGLTPSNAFYDAVVQVFFFGGPSQTDTLDPKPGSANNRFNTVALGVNDKYGKPVNVSTVLSNVRNAVQSGTCGLGIIRSLVHTSGDHDLATMMTQSFWRTAGPAMSYPSIG
jgi:hypothetical protein